MDSAALLDLLGNENRRRILRLLARKPCYVTEISEYLGVSPKAVIDHLRKLEDAGLVESRMDERRRKYFHISRNLRLEVNVSPYEFGAKSAYPASRSFDITAWRYLTVDVSLDEDGHAPGELATELSQLQALENELSMAQRWVQGRITETVEELCDAVDGDADGDGRLHADLLVRLADGPMDTTELSEAVDAPPAVVEDGLVALAEQGIVDRDEDGWYLRED
ncbi:ArsR family transcriptional regulator [Salinarchaeum chitinilyticum]